MKRTFIAVPIPLLPSVAALLTNLKTRLYGDKIRWVDPGNMHLTLFFLGDTDESKIPGIISFLNDIFSNAPEFDIELAGVGMFSRQQKPQVVWIGIKNYDHLTEMKKKLDNKLAGAGFKPDNRPFKPHLTLGRIKYVSDKKQFGAVMNGSKNKVFGKMRINKVLFYESELSQSGPVYTPLHTLLLQG